MFPREISLVAGGGAGGREGAGGTRFDSPLARSPKLDILAEPPRPKTGSGIGFQTKMGITQKKERTTDEIETCDTNSARRIFLEGSGNLVRLF